MLLCNVISLIALWRNMILTEPLLELELVYFIYNTCTCLLKPLILHASQETTGYMFSRLLLIIYVFALWSCFVAKGLLKLLVDHLLAIM